MRKRYRRRKRKNGLFALIWKILAILLIAAAAFIAYDYYKTGDFRLVEETWKEMLPAIQELPEKAKEMLDLLQNTWNSFAQKYF